MDIKNLDIKQLLRLDTALNEIMDYDMLLEKILLEARKILQADAGSIYAKISEKENGAAVDKLAIKHSQNDTIQSRLPEGHKMVFQAFSVPIDNKSISGYSALKRALINIPDMYEISPDAPYSFNSAFDKISGYKTTSTLTYPLAIADGTLLGVIQLINAKDEKQNIIPFSPDDELLLSHFAVTAAAAMHRAYLTNTMLMRMLKMAELHDPFETGPHVNRVSSYSLELYDGWARKRQIPGKEKEKFRNILKMGAMFHDIGKIAISNTITKKDGKLTDSEFSIMQMHTCHGARFFQDIHSPIDALARDIALTHHENWDGSGYPGWIDPFSMSTLKEGEGGKPAGKKGEEIPLGARIVALADVFDALSSKRSYKRQWSEGEVLSEIRSLSGSKFDPELVEIFFEVLPNIRQVQNMYPYA